MLQPRIQAGLRRFLVAARLVLHALEGAGGDEAFQAVGDHARGAVDGDGADGADGGADGVEDASVELAGAQPGGLGLVPAVERALAAVSPAAGAGDLARALERGQSRGRSTRPPTCAAALRSWLACSQIRRGTSVGSLLQAP